MSQRRVSSRSFWGSSRWAGLAASMVAGAFLYFGFRLYRAMFQNLGRSEKLVRMGKREILDFLNYALALELEQVEFYRDQYQAVIHGLGDEHLATGIKRAMNMEQEHVSKIKEKIKEMGHKPTSFTRIAPLVGEVAGMVGGQLSALNILKANVWVEQKAIDHYLRVLNQVDDPVLKTLLMENLVDEEFHAAWAQEKIEQMLQPDEGDSFSGP